VLESILNCLFLMQKLDAVNILCGKVDCQAHRSFCQSLGVRAYPTVRLFLPEERGDGIDLSSRSSDDLVNIVKSKRAGANNHHDEL
jgi:Thioredoxin